MGYSQAGLKSGPFKAVGLTSKKQILRSAQDDNSFFVIAKPASRMMMGKASRV
jgi:hypothetical protein